jgi:hypothetical protein
MCNLTHLQLSSVVEVEPGALAGKAQLQHLELCRCDIPGGTAGVSEFLSHLQQLQQLTHLTVSRTLQDRKAVPPAAAYSALTASSKLQHLDISTTVLPPGAWKHMFLAGNQLLHLQSLDISYVMQQNYSYTPAPDFCPLVSCCPSLQQLSMRYGRCNAALLAPLRGLTGLGELYMSCLNHIPAGLLLQLTELQQLTTLNYDGMVGAAHLGFRRRAHLGFRLACKVG